MPISRNQQNFIIMSVIYIELNDFNYGDKELSRSAKEMMYEMVKDYDPDATQIPPFIEDMVNASLLNYGAAVKAYSPKLKDWKWERLPLLTQAILIMSYTHFYTIEKVDKAIIIDVAVNLAKEYIEEKQARFIHAVLDEALV